MSENSAVIGKSSALLEVQKESGLLSGEIFGWQMAKTYGDVLAEVRSVRTQVGLIDLSFCGAIKIGGKEAVQFLQGLVSNDVKTLPKGKGMRAAFLTGHGKVKAFCHIFNLGEEFLLLNAPQTHDKVYKFVFPFSYAGDFLVEDVSEQFKVLSVQGPNSLLVLKETCFEPVPQLQEYEWVKTLIAGHQAMVVKHSRTGEQGYDILIAAPGLKDVWEFLLLKGKFHALAPFGLQALNILRIEAAIPEYGIDIDENNMLLEAGLDDVVSFTKGCYTGQEAVAMATYRGHISKKLSCLAFPNDAPVALGDKLFAEAKELGTVSSVAASEILDKNLALACVKYGFFDIGTKVEVETKAGKVVGEIIKPVKNL